MEEKSFVVDSTAQRLKDDPGFDKDHWPTMADAKWGESTYSYYNRQPYWSAATNHICIRCQLALRRGVVMTNRTSRSVGQTAPFTKPNASVEPRFRCGYSPSLAGILDTRFSTQYSQGASAVRTALMRAALDAQPATWARLASRRMGNTRLLAFALFLPALCENPLKNGPCRLSVAQNR